MKGYMVSSISAVIVAGGKGERMRTNIRKQYLVLGNLPVLSHTLAVFDLCPVIHRIYLVVPEPDRDFCAKEVVAPIEPQTPVHLVSGGAFRQASVYHGLCAIPDTDGVAVIHDGVRPFVSGGQIETVARSALKYGACIFGIPAVDTLKQVDADNYIARTVARQTIRLAQTPQAFQYSIIKKAHDLAMSDGVIGTDDASLVERLGIRVLVIPGSPRNIKITTPDDLLMAQAIYDAGIRE